MSHNSLPECSIISRIQHPSLVGALVSIRTLCEAVAGEAPRLIPEFTDHTVKHMDSIVELTDIALTDGEIDRMSQAECFLLAASCYIHDLGMTAPCICEVKTALFNEFSIVGDPDDDTNTVNAIRDYHADFAYFLATERIPKLDRFCIEDELVRSVFSEAVGNISASHCWPMSKVDDELGQSGEVPFGEFGNADLGYVACILRVVDYMDISVARAPRLVFSSRSFGSKLSINHWKAQMRVMGPLREEGFLKYASNSHLESIESWWLAWDLLSGLSVELNKVSRYLRDRSCSHSRFSLYGVVGIESPETFSKLIKPPRGSLPVDIRVTATSMSRVISMLGGETLYGNDKMAPLRELIQNARDAIYAREKIDPEYSLCSGHIDISIDDGWLEVGDNGIGMTLPVITDHLLGLGASYWNSDLAKRELGPGEVSHAGRYGVGFVSVFMLGSLVSVQTGRPSGSSYAFELSGLDRRGSIRVLTDSGVSAGTSVKINVENDVAQLISTDRVLSDTVKSRAPMLEIEIRTSIGSGESDSLSPYWWLGCGEEELFKFIDNWRSMAFPSIAREKQRYPLRSSRMESVSWPNGTPFASSNKGFLVLGPRTAGLLVCSLGLAVQVVPHNLVTGMIDMGDQSISISRGSLLGAEIQAVSDDSLDWATLENYNTKDLYNDLYESTVAKLEELTKYGMVSQYHRLLVYCFKCFGGRILEELDLEWIPTMKPSGEYRYYSRLGWMNEVREAKHFWIVMGTSGPDLAYSIASQLSETLPLEGLVMPFRGGGFDIGFNDKENLQKEHGPVIKGTLRELEELFHDQLFGENSIYEYLLCTAFETKGTNLKLDLSSCETVVSLGRSYSDKSGLVAIQIW